MADEIDTADVGEEPLADATDETHVDVGEEPHDEVNADNIDDILDSLSEEELDAITNGEELPVEEVQPDEVEEVLDKEDPEEEQGEEEEGEEPQPEAQESDDLNDDAPPKRIRLENLSPEHANQVVHLVNAVRNGIHPDIQTAAAAMYPDINKTNVDESEVVDEQVENEEPVVPQEIQQIDEKLKDLRAQRLKAKKDYDAEAEAGIQDEIEDTLLEKQQITNKLREEKASAESYNESFYKYVDQAIAKFPDLNDESSALSKQVQLMKDAAEFRKSTELQDPGFILKMAEQAAEGLGLIKQPEPEPEPQSKVEKKVIKPAKQARPLGQVASGNKGYGDLSKEDAIKALDNLDAESLEKLFDETAA